MADTTLRNETKRNETKPGEIYNETKGIMQMYFLIR